MSLLAHGGTAGAVVEFSLVLGIAVVFITVWLRERRLSRNEEEVKDESSTDDDLLRYYRSDDDPK